MDIYKGTIIVMRDFNYPKHFLSASVLLEDTLLDKQNKHKFCLLQNFEFKLKRNLRLSS